MFENSSQNYEGTPVVVDNPQRIQDRQDCKTEPAESRKAGTRLGSSSTVDFRVDFGPSRKDILNSTNQLAVMIRAGISLQGSLESIAELQGSQKFAAVITNLKNQIEESKSLSQALTRHSQIFSNLYVNKVAAAEISGSLSFDVAKIDGVSG